MMRKARVVGRWLLIGVGYIGAAGMALAQCPSFSNFSSSGDPVLCEGGFISISMDGQNIPGGSSIDWYLGLGTSFNPYNGDGTLVGTVPVIGESCNNQPEVLYIMVNPDNTQVGSSGDQCDEFLVLWTGSGGFSLNDITISNLGPGTLMWDDFAPGNAGTFSCGVPLPPGPVPENAILIIQSSPNNNVMINSDVLCASGLPVYIITYTGTVDCMFGYFDNNSPCSSCPINIVIDGMTCDYTLNPTYTPPGSSIDGWAWANTGAGVYANIIPTLNFPLFDPPDISIADFVYNIRPDFCETFGPGDWHLVGILDPPPPAGCPEILTPYFEVNVSCPELNLSGGGEVCEGNCPDNPTVISFDIVGNDVPFTADLLVTASIFPPFPINGLPVTNGYTIQVCLGGLFPSFNPGTGVLTIPTLAIGITATVQIVSLVSNAGCPVEYSPASVTLSFIAAPNANSGPDQTICEGETVSLNGNIGGSATNAEWTTSGDGVFDDPSDLTTVYTPGPNDITNGTVTITLLSTDPNGTCTPAESELEITIEPSIFIQTNTPLTICDQDVANVIAMVTGGTVTCQWETSGDGQFDDPAAENTIYTPGAGDISSGTVILTYMPVNAGTCIGTIQPLVLTIVPAPQVSVPQNLEACIGDPVVLNINVQGSYALINWSTNGDGVLTLINDMEATYDPGPMDINGQFVIISITVQSIFPECGSTTYNILININDCGCPDLETIPPSMPVCALSGSIDLQNLLVEGPPGNWVITSSPPGVNPAVITGTIFMTNNSDAGSYVLTYQVSAPEPGCPPSSSENILVTLPIQPEAGPDQTVCGPDSVLLSGLFVPSIMADFQWETLGDGYFSDPFSLITTYYPGSQDSLQPGVMLSLHVTDTICGDMADTLNVFFENAPFATLLNDTVMICNATAYGSVINASALIVAGDIAGTWINVNNAPITISNGMWDFDGVPTGFYLFQYQTNAVFPCPSTTYDLIIQVVNCACPLLIINNPPSGICNSLNALPLDAFIQAGGPGSWQILSSPPGTNPATLTGSTLNVLGRDQGDYRLRFTFDAAPLDGCPDSAELTLFVQEPPAIVLQNDTLICDVGMIPLQAFLGGSATNVQWTTTGSGTFSPQTGTPSAYQPIALDVFSGQIFLIGTTLDTFGYCPADVDSIRINFLTPPSAAFSQFSTSICNNPDSGSVVNLQSFLIGGDIHGTWADSDGSGVNLGDLTAVDFDGVAPGMYVFMYSTNSAVPPCEDQTYSFEVTVRDCSCPALLLKPEDVILCAFDNYDLSQQIIEAAPGNWSVTSGPPGTPFPPINGGIISTNGMTNGTYILTFTLQDSIPGCITSAQIKVIVEVDPVVLVEAKSCSDDQNFYTIIFSTQASVVVPNVGQLTDLGGAKYEVDSIPMDQTLQLTVTSPLGACTYNTMIVAPNCNCALQIEDLVDTLTLCPGDSFRLIPFVTGVAGFPHTYWIDQNQDTTAWFSFEVNKPGTYIWVVIDSLGCEARDTFTSVFIGPTDILFTSIPPSCPTETNGMIILEEIVDGLPPFSIQVDTGLPVSVGVFPYTVNQVGIGLHQVRVTDLTGCTLTVPVTINNSAFGTIDLGPDRTIMKGDSVQITPSISNLGVGVVQYNYPFLPADLSAFYFKPDETSTIEITLTDTSGCIYTDDVTIQVVEQTLFYIPNAFSPNGDQINDQVIVFTNLPDEQLVSFEIFDRWGGMLHRQISAGPFSWNGTSAGEEANPGVYVYKLTWKDTDGNTLVRIGDITLVR